MGDLAFDVDDCTAVVKGVLFKEYYDKSHDDGVSYDTPAEPSAKLIAFNAYYTLADGTPWAVGPSTRLS